jgi:hypothetical protein
LLRRRPKRAPSERQQFPLAPPVTSTRTTFSGKGHDRRG